MTCTCTIETPLGAATARADGEALTGFWFVGQKYYPSQTGAWLEQPDLPVFTALRRWLDQYFQGKNEPIPFPVVAGGTPFQQEVWAALLEIPYGEQTTYGEIAARLAKKQGRESLSAQAVGSAVGRNPISLVIPCHRVVGANGSLTGYAGGLEKKMALLKLEQAL